MNDISPSTRRISAKEQISSLKKSDLLIFSKTSLDTIRPFKTNANVIDGGIFMSNLESIDKYLKYISKNISKVFTFGGGSIIDVGKYIAHQKKLGLCCILPILSTNAFSTDKVSLYLKNESKKTIQAKLPDEIILDLDLLKMKPAPLSLLGLSEVLSIHTALFDWTLGVKYRQEIMNRYIYGIADEIFNDMVSSLDAILLGNEKSIEIIYQLVSRSGEVTRLYGSGRPESGSEHIVAKELEKNKNIPHGLAVAIGVLSMSLLQNNNPDMIVWILNKIGIIKLLKKYDCNLYDIETALRQVGRSQERFTILDIYKINQRFITKVNSAIKGLVT